ncbi:marvel domain-containing protein [Dactylonectria estremocensis]|uniref:Marvel domain-containing protein n=1 Tax=Dactylonectria estremocensis TaxID=1079267 RepID=A0A9P9EZM6_9HYPO|nr:marvel domain-containing protein [Dactylonectria estremocensis]
MVGVNMIKMILRCVALFITVLLTAMIGNVIATNIDGYGSATAAVNFIMFVAVVSWIVSIVGIAAFFASVLANPMIQTPLDSAAVLFTFIAAVVISAKLRMVDCGDITEKKMPSEWIAWGGPSDEKRCRELQAGAVFSWFLLALFSGSLFFTLKEARERLGGSFRAASRPSMSQLHV